MDTIVKLPVITVLMPVYNGEKYLRDAISSILNQDFKDFEFLIINDGSTDSSPAIINSYTDPRIRFIDNEKNIGLVATLNKGLELATGQFIVRMDCDDISLSKRLSVQLKFMEANKHIGASGSYYYKLIDEKKVLADFPLSSEEISAFLIFNSPIAHPSAIIRKSILDTHQIRYHSEFIHAEDYDLWSQVSAHSGLANVANPLLHYRVHTNQITSKPELITEKARSVNAIRQRHLTRLGVIPTSEEMKVHSFISDGIAPENQEQFYAAEQWLEKLVLHNNTHKVVDNAYFQKIILERWLRFCFNFLGSKKGVMYFLNSKLKNRIHLRLQLKLQLLHSIYHSWKRKK